MFAKMLGQKLKDRGLKYTPHYVEKFMGHRQRILVDADVGVYRYDQLIVLKNNRVPAALLEAGLDHQPRRGIADGFAGVVGHHQRGRGRGNRELLRLSLYAGRALRTAGPLVEEEDPEGRDEGACEPPMNCAAPGGVRHLTESSLFHSLRRS